MTYGDEFILALTIWREASNQGRESNKGCPENRQKD